LKKTFAEQIIGFDGMDLKMTVVIDKKPLFENGSELMADELIVKLNSAVEKREAESYNDGLERAAEIADLVVKDSDIRGESDVTTAGRISAARKIAKQIRQEKKMIGASK